MKKFMISAVLFLSLVSMISTSMPKGDLQIKVSDHGFS